MKKVQTRIEHLVITRRVHSLPLAARRCVVANGVGTHSISYTRLSTLTDDELARLYRDLRRS